MGIREDQQRLVDELNEAEQVLLDPGETSLDLMRKIYRNPRQPMYRRIRAAEQALQFEHPKLGAVATTAMNGADFASLLEKAILRSAIGRPLRQIEAQVEHDAMEFRPKGNGK
jgi:hypothetical protein